VGTNGNVSSASSINLRGLGADASLTLLNGHRLPQDSAVSGVDISAIPIGAIDRIEVIADGASAIYGSDAVGGVANVILRHDFEGILTSARLGSSTQGGDFQNQEGIVAGHRWSSGGFMATYDYDSATAITAGERAYANNMGKASTLIPSLSRHAVVVTAHQAIGDRLTLSVDGLYNRRVSAYRDDSTTGSAYANMYNPSLETFSIAPELAITLPSSWQSKLMMSYGKDTTHYNTRVASATANNLTTGCYCDEAFSAEANADGPLFRLPGGSAHAALGGGYRSNSMAYSRILNGSQQGAFSVNRTSYYVFGELALPLLKPDRPLPLLKSLSLSAAARYENYPGLAQLTTPKFGLTYEPDANIAIKASWGRSFKAPTLYQQYVGYQEFLLSAGSYGAGPAGKTFIYLTGGNPDLKPERAHSWTVGFDVHPQAVPGLTLEASYYNIHYINRAVQPITSLSTAFSNAGYASLLQNAPSASTISSLAAGSLYGLQNYTTSTYDPTSVISLVDGRYRNVAQQQIEGVDLSLAYKHPLGITNR
jgi:outer membrane cobalamin receptor